MSNATEETTTLLAFDVGGSNCRAVAAVLADGELEPHARLRRPISTPVSSRSELRGFVRDVLERFADGGTPARAGVAFAGPVAGGGVQLTNWPDQDHVSMEDLVDWGLPASGTLMVNDAEAGAHGLVRLLRDKRAGEEAFHPLRVTASTAAAGSGNMVLLMPGTGLGCAGIVRLEDDDGEARFVPVASEGGHLPAAPLDTEHGRLIELIRGDLGGATPNWENFVSGPGLVTIYRRLAPEGPEPHVDLSGQSDAASAIAAAARAGSDLRSARALQLYYRCVGGFAQSLALAYLARGGVFIAGSSTRRNRQFIADTSLMDEFLANHEQRELLERIPVYLVLEELNLVGGLALIARGL